MLFAVGGLLKVEGRNYLSTKKLIDPEFETAAPVREATNEGEKMLEGTKHELS